MRLGNLASTFTTLLLVVAVGAVLITPDWTDDANGIIRSQKTLAAVLVAVVLAYSLHLRSAHDANGLSLTVLSSPNLLRLLCTCRC